VADAVIEADFR